MICTIKLLRCRPGSDIVGQPVDIWDVVVAERVFADIRHPSGMETIRAGASVSTVRTSIRINRRRDVDASMRVQHGADVYEIRAVLPDEVEGQFMVLVCERIV